MVAVRADTSTRTVYRVLSEHSDAINLPLADRLLVAVGAHLDECELVWGEPDGTV